jgi:uncharacterized protein DUF6644
MDFAIGKWLGALSTWLEHTALSHAIQVTSWVIPTTQTIHIMAIAAVASSALMVDLRLIGVFAADQPARSVSARFLPFVWWPLLVLLASGALLIIAEPGRSLRNPAFQLKMTLLLAAVVVTSLLQRRLQRDATFGERGSPNRLAAIAIAALSMLLWSTIIFAGRWIAYYR